MKIKFLLLSLGASLALALPASAGSHHFAGGGGGGSGSNSHASGGHSAPSRMSSARAGGMYGQRFATARHMQPGINGQRFAAAGQRQSGRTAGMTGPHVTNGHFNSGGAHIVARQSANAHPNWSHNHDHFWHGHHCRFVNNSWVIFDFGFYDPWYWGYPYGYPYAYGYPYGYPYGGTYGSYDDSNDGGVYDGKDAGYQGSDNGSSQDSGSAIATAQGRLKRLGYYHGRIDGRMGPATERAISDYQRDHGQRVTGSVTRNTLNSFQARE